MMLRDLFPAALVRLLSKPLPQRIASYNGVAVRDVPFFHIHDYRPTHKRDLWDATRAHVEAGDAVTFVGGGVGVVPVKTAAYGCDVTVIEAAAECIDQLHETAMLNQVEMKIVHGIVEAGYDIFGDGSEARTLTTADLEGDVLVLDCEGAEQDILPAPQFDRIIVETHPQHGATTDKIRSVYGGDIQHWSRTNHHGDILVKA